MKQKITFFKVLLTLVLLCGVGNAWGEKSYTKLFTIKSAGVISGTSYKTHSATVDLRGWIITFGGNNTSVGTNSGNRNNCKLESYPKYAVSPVTQSDVASAFVSTTSISDVSKISYTFSGGSNQGSTYVYLIYSADGNTFSQISLTSGSQGATISSGTAFEFAKCSGYFGLLFKATNSSGNWRIDNVDVTFYKEESSEPLTVLFNTGTNGTCETKSLTEAPAGSGVTLPACTANDGYVFKGWSTTENGTTADAGMAGATYKPSSDCTLYAVYNKAYVLTITQPTDGGTLIVSDGANTLSTGDKVEVGTTLTCEVADIPEGLRFSRFYAKWGDDESNYKATNPATFDKIPTDISTLEVYVTYMPLKKCTINYMVNGVNTNAQENVYEGTELVFPIVHDFGGKVFMGWSETEIAEATDVKPTLVETATLTATANTTYYAVFATLTKGEGVTKTDVLNRSFTEVTDGSQTYTNWSKSAPNSEATYSGNSAGDNNSIQLRWNTSSTTKRAGIVTTVSGGVVKKITVVWDSNTLEGRTLNVYGSNTAFTSWEDVNTITSDPIGTIVCGTSTTLNIDGDYQYIALRSNENAMYLTSISIDWVQGAPDSYSAYCTSVAPLTQDVDITSAGYATAYIPFAATVEGATAYYVTVDGDKAQLNEIKGTIRAETGVVLKGAKGTATFTESAVEPTTDVSANKMVGTLTTETFSDPKFVYYRLANNNGSVGFYKQHEEGWAECAAGKAVLAVPTGSAAPSFFTFDDATAINAISNAKVSAVRYNLNGQAVGEDYKGIVIVNGKKMFNK